MPAGDIGGGRGGRKPAAGSLAVRCAGVGRAVQPAMMRALAPMLFLAALAGCATAPRGMAPSLAPRSAEAIDPRVPVPTNIISGPADPVLAARLAGLVEQARGGDRAFRVAAAEAERLAGAAGAPQSESWIVAQQALSGAIAAREPTTRALGDVDAVGALALATSGGLAPGDLAAVESAAAEVGAIDRAQAARLAAVQARLGG